MRRLVVITGLVCLAAGLAHATIFRLDPPAPRQSPKTETLTPDDMFNICGFEKQDTPFFTDKEYQRAIYQYGLEMHRLDPSSSAYKRLEGLQEGMKECRENDRNKRYAAQAKRSCKELVKAHKAASDRAWAAAESKTVYKSEIMSWGERFREPLEKCLKSMRCRLDSKKDMAEALSVYREVVDEMQGWILDVKDVERMKICGVTVRDLRKWCTVDVSTEGNTTTVKDICTDTKTIRDMINLLQTMKPLVFPPAPPGGAVNAGAPR